ncbi:hypothetical protein [Streptomyces sp. NPDC058291]|jgi:hypothetical protein|uniref:hypothetical protein n=1 Tax=Streptomyces sp. NPDC058291 TaxID=3346427 RepID=UPI0036EE0B80
MTVTEDRITMAEESVELSLDVMFEWLEKMPVPEGTKVEIVGGNIVSTGLRHRRPLQGPALPLHPPQGR